MEEKFKEEIYDIAIIGGGPAAFSAAIYALHGNLKVVFIEKEVPGGKVTKTQSVKNYPGFEDIHGADLSLKMLNHTMNLGSEFIFDEVIKIDNKNDRLKYLYLKSNTSKIIKSKFVIIATGMIENVPPINNINKFLFKGVSYCAICDGGLFNGKVVAVIGGGDSAVEESIYLSSVALKVHLFMRRDVFRANKKAVEHLKSIEKIKVHYNTHITELLGKEYLKGIITINKNNEEIKYENVEGLFPYIGTKPVTDFLKDLNITDDLGYIIVDENMKTIVEGIYAIGDVIQKTIRQISTAINDGTIAAKSIVNENA